jgi:hypothetical protein
LLARIRDALPRPSIRRSYNESDVENLAGFSTRYRTDAAAGAARQKQLALLAGSFHGQAHR